MEGEGKRLPVTPHIQLFLLNDFNNYYNYAH